MASLRRSPDNKGSGGVKVPAESLVLLEESPTQTVAHGSS